MKIHPLTAVVALVVMFLSGLVFGFIQGESGGHQRARDELRVFELVIAKERDALDEWAKHLKHDPTMLISPDMCFDCAEARDAKP